MSARQVCEDLRINHARELSTKLVQSVSAHVEDVAMGHEFDWHYDLPVFDEVVSQVSIGRDGTTTAIRGEGYRETMCGTISFYNSVGERLHTIYSAGAKDNWTYLLKYVQVDVLDFYHATEYLTKASVLLKKGEQAQKQWANNAGHDLKHQKNSA